MREISNKIENKINIINQKFENINNKMSEIDTKFESIFNKVVNQNQNNTKTQNDIESLLRMLNTNNNSVFSSSLNNLRNDSIIEFRGFKMRADVAAKFIKLEEMIKQEFPGRQIIITSGMDGQHMPGSKHYEGKAIDFVVEPLTIEESKKIEELAKKAGFDVYNEYIYDSPYKTGPHMHIQIP
ncbi:MAG: hypothetical protein N2485_07655 [bacterium]|nr:hypothetical protein [bacterium]